MSSTGPNPYEFSRSNMVLQIGSLLLVVFLVAVTILSGTPPTMTPKNSANSAIRNMVGRIKTNATK